MIAMLWVGIGGFLGANARYLLGGWIAGRLGTIFPYGTFVINITGSFILGFFLTFVQDRPWVPPAARMLFAIGFLGAYTTFSTFTYESVALVENGELLLAAVNALGSVVVGMSAVFAGIVVGRAI